MKKILVIDDEPDIQALLKVRLEANEYEVIIASDGKEGFNKVVTEKPDLVILDLMLPKANGYWVCNILKHDKRFSGIPIIIISAKSEKSDLSTAKECGADAYLVKPFDSEKLLARIHRFLKDKKK